MTPARRGGSLAPALGVTEERNAGSLDRAAVALGHRRRSARAPSGRSASRARVARARGRSARRARRRRVADRRGSGSRCRRPARVGVEALAAGPRLLGAQACRIAPARALARYWERPEPSAFLAACAPAPGRHVLANDWTALPIAARIARERGGRFGYDTHEYATEEYAQRGLLASRPPADREGRRGPLRARGGLRLRGVARDRRGSEPELRPRAARVRAAQSPALPGAASAGTERRRARALSRHPRAEPRARGARRQRAGVAARATLTLRGPGEPAYVASLRRRAEGQGRIAFAPSRAGRGSRLRGRRLRRRRVRAAREIAPERVRPAEQAVRVRDGGPRLVRDRPPGHGARGARARSRCADPRRERGRDRRGAEQSWIASGSRLVSATRAPRREGCAGRRRAGGCSRPASGSPRGAADVPGSRFD
ncbi:MAG: hypothetical protein MZW92_53090 [Comamonadaceae bacterium]|nr:hypothetical protein [Comamonadaceae bacterium]